MKTIILFLLLLTIACSKPTKPLTNQSLIGKTISYTYGESVYHLIIDSDSTLHWEAMHGEETGVKGDERFISEWIDTDKLFITWGEENGISVSQVLDFKKQKVSNHILRGRKARAGEGKIKIL